MPRRFGDLWTRACVGTLLLVVACAVAAGGPKAYVGNFKDNTVSVVDTGTNAVIATVPVRSEEHTSELQSLTNLVCRLLLEKKKVDAYPVGCFQRSKAVDTSV